MFFDKKQRGHDKQKSGHDKKQSCYFEQKSVNDKKQNCFEDQKRVINLTTKGMTMMQKRFKTLVPAPAKPP